MSFNSLPLPGTSTSRFSRKGDVSILLGKVVRRFIFSFPSLVGLFFFTTTTIALLTHKILIIKVHGPFTFLQLLFLGPFTFSFDFLTLYILHRAFCSASGVWRSVASIISFIICACSSTFVSMYFIANSEISWGRSIAVIANWSFFGKMMASGNDGPAKTFLMFSLFGIAAIISSITMGKLYPEHSYNDSEEKFATETPKKRLIQRHPGFFFVIFLLFGTIFIPRDPWKHMSSTILYDVISAISTTIVEKSLREMQPNCPSTVASGGHPLISTNYSPAKDPFYISNLNEPVIPWIAEAIKDLEITNVVQIVLESVRADSYPFEENGLLHQHIKNKLHLAENGVPITTETVTPFIASLANHTIVWNNTWSICPLTHKAMLGFYCGELPLPIDFGAEFIEPAKNYQTCFPKVFNHLHAVTNQDNETIAMFRDEMQSVTDVWDVAHVAAFSGNWDRTREHLRYFGFNTIVDAQLIEEVRGGQEWPHFQGYYDEDGLQYLWQYVDWVTGRKPRNRMYLAWMSQVTHWGLPLNPAWAERGYQHFIQDEQVYDTVDAYLNGLRETDDNVKTIIEGFRERGLEDETLFIIHGDHGFPFIGEWQTPIDNPHNDPYRTPFILYNPRLNNPTQRIATDNVYALGMPSTILDLMIETNTFTQRDQKSLARKFATNYEYSQSYLRPVKETIRFFLVNPGGSQWVLDNGRNLRIRFDLNGPRVTLVDYVIDPREEDVWDSWEGIEGLIRWGVDERFGVGTEKFLREAQRREKWMRGEIMRRYGLSSEEAVFEEEWDEGKGERK